MGIGNDGGGSLLMTLIGYAGAVISTVFLGAWKARGIQADLVKKIDDQAITLRKEAADGIANLRKEAADKRDESVNQMGEGLHAIREAINQMALWNRDTFVRRDDFQIVVDSFTKSVDGLRHEVKDGNIRLNDKLDRVIKDGRDHR